MVLHLRQEAVHCAQLRVPHHGLTVPIVIRSLGTYARQQSDMGYTHAADISGIHPLSPVRHVRQVSGCNEVREQ
jgi:hypothetical protein